MKYAMIVLTGILLITCYTTTASVLDGDSVTPIQPVQCERMAVFATDIADERMRGESKEELAELFKDSTKALIVLDIVYSMEEVMLPVAAKIVYTVCMRHFNTV